MDFPFHRSQWAKPSASNFYEPTIARGIPVRPEEVKTATRMTPKVVQIPVHFVRSESAPDRFKPASIIQKIFRGFLTRKNVRKIMAIKKEVDEIEARVWRSDEVALMKKDGKERLKVNEMLMALLFVLDSVLSVDAGVRNLRKAVIRKVIALQERVDAVAATAASADIDRIQPEPDALAEEEKDHQARDQVLVIQHVAAAGANSAEASNSEGRPPEIQDLADAAVGNSVQKVHFSVVQVPQSSDVVDFENNGSAQGVDREDDVRADSEMKAKDCVEDAEEFGIDSKMKVDAEASLVTVLDIVDNKASSEARVVESLMEDKEAQVFDSMMEFDGEVEDMREKTPAFSECVEKSVETIQMEVGIGGEEDNEGENSRVDDNKGNRGLLERMMEENEKMMKLMTQLYERNEVQTRILNTLTHRVEQLEKAFVCDKIKRKKKRNSA